MKSPLEQNYYELLEVPRDATLAEIDRAYDRARAYYGAGSVAVYTLAAPEELKLVQDRIDEAYLILADEKARAEYDARIGPPGPNERPLHREVREAREKDAAREAEKREAEKRAAEEAAAAPREPTPAPVAAAPAPAPPPEVPREPTPAQPVAAVKREPTPAQPLAAVKREPTPAQPLAAVKREPTPAQPLAAVAANRALEGPIPPPPMEFPEPAPCNANRPQARPPEASGKPVPPRPDVPADAVFSGELLKRLRESAGLSLQEIADRTKIGKAHLENIESDRHGALPAQVYLRGFLMALARELRLDPLRVSKSYLDQMAASKTKPAAKPRS